MQPEAVHFTKMRFSFSFFFIMHHTCCTYTAIGNTWRPLWLNRYRKTKTKKKDKMAQATHNATALCVSLRRHYTFPVYQQLCLFSQTCLIWMCYYKRINAVYLLIPSHFLSSTVLLLNSKILNHLNVQLCR